MGILEFSSGFGLLFMLPHQIDARESVLLQSLRFLRGWPTGFEGYMS